MAERPVSDSHGEQRRKSAADAVETRRRKRQAAAEPLRMLRESEILEALGISRTTLWRWRRDEGFPAPLRIGPATNAWPAAAVERWIASRPSAGGAEAA